MKQSQAKWKKDFWVPEIKKQMDILVRIDENSEETMTHARQILINEIDKEDYYWENLECIDCIDSIKNGTNYSMSRFSKLNSFLDFLTVQFNKTITTTTVKSKRL